MKIILANPRGFCAGVNMAIDGLERALELFGTPLYVYHEIVHNRAVVERFIRQGVVFVNAIEEVPEGATVLYSAHGVSPALRAAAARRRLRAIDATCPLVTKVHLEAARFARLGYTIVLIGHRDHDEVIGTLGEAPHCTVVVSSVEEVDRLSPPDPSRVAYITQTTLSLDETSQIVARLRERFPAVQGPAAQDICYATENRQRAVKAVAPLCQLLLVVGSQNSSNSKRLVEVARNSGVRAYLVDDASELDPGWFENVETVAVTAGASAPENLVQDLVRVLASRGFSQVEEMTLKEEDVRFTLPPQLVSLVARPTPVEP